MITCETQGGIFIAFTFHSGLSGRHFMLSV